MCGKYQIKGELKPFVEKIIKITKLSKERFLELMTQKQSEALGSLHEKIAIMKVAIDLVEIFKNRDLNNVVKNYMSKNFEDICFSKNLDIYTISSYICTYSNLNMDPHSFGMQVGLELFECTCSQFSTNGQCVHINIYKEKFFDPWFIPDNQDLYYEYNDIWPEDISFNELITQYPRWVIDYIIQNWLKYYTPKGLAEDNLHISYYFQFEKLLKLLKKYREKEVLSLKRNIQERFLEPIEKGVYSGDFNLNDEMLPTIPDNIPIIEFLDLGGNRLSRLPNSFKNLKYLKELNLEGNEFKNIPELIGAFRSLEVLKLNYNQIEKIPDSISKLKNLKILELEKNKLQTLPDCFNELKNIEDLNLDDNKFNILPEIIKDLPSLKYLSFCGNKIKELPEWIKKRPSLEIKF